MKNDNILLNVIWIGETLFLLNSFLPTCWSIVLTIVMVVGYKLLKGGEKA